MMATYFWIIIMAVGILLVGSGVYLLIKNYPKQAQKSKTYQAKPRKTKENLRDANEQIQDLLRDFEEKWRNRQ